MKTHRAASNNKVVVVVDDDSLVLEATAGLLRSWGCLAVTANSYGAALARLSEIRRRPDLIICDYRLSEGETGIEVIESLRGVFEIPALLISGDPGSVVDEHGSNGYHFLHKPLDAAKFRAMLVDASVLRC